MKSERYKISKDYKALQGHFKFLNRIIEKGNTTEKQEALNELNKVINKGSEQKHLCIVRTIRNRPKVKYVYVPTDSDIEDDDICIIQKLRPANE